MTQKRGLGRGLGALIPGAGSAPAPEQELRTRTRPEPEAGSGAASSRPVDMFFSGEKVSSEDSPQRGGDGARDLAVGMARAAAERRGRTGAASTAKRSSSAKRTTATKPSGAAGAAADSETGTGSTTSKSTPAKDAAKSTPTGGAKGSSTSRRSTTSKTGSTGKAGSTSKSGSTSKAGAASKGGATSRSGVASKSGAASKSGSSAKGGSPAKTGSPATSVGGAKGTTSAKTASPATRTGTAKAPDAPADDSTPSTSGTRSAQAEAAPSRPSDAAAAPRSEAAAPTSGSTPVQDSSASTEGVPSAPEAPTRARAENSPVVDVEAVEYTRVRDDAGSDAAPVDADLARADTEGSGADDDRPAVTEADAAPPASAPADSPGADAPPVDVPDDAAEEEPSRAPEPSAIEGQGLLSVPGAEFAEIPIHEVRENPRNPRTMFDEEELDELAYSLREVGVLQPVVVRPIPVTEDGESFELVMGERRWRAARRAGLTAIPAIIRETSDDDLLRDALLENLHRTQLNPLEEANAYQQLLDDFGCTQDELGERIGRSRPQVTNTLRLLRLPALVQRRLASGAISAGHARALLSLDDPTLMEELAQRIVSEGLSVRAVERLVARGGEQQTTRTVRRSTYDPHVVDLTSRLSNRLEAPVRIDVGKRKGKVTLEFTNLEDLERLIENMGLDIPLPE